MSDLIPIMPRKLGGEVVNTVDARDLYVFLDIDTAFTPWIKRSLTRANQIEDVDFTVYAKNGTNPHGGRPSHEYYLTFDAAKHVAMMSSATKGHEVRAYFIQKEKELASLTANPDGILDRYPELRAIADLAISVAHARDLAQEAQARAVAAELRAAQADAKADVAIDGHRMTIEEYVIKNGDTRQYPPSEYRRMATWLGNFCQQWGIEVHKVPVIAKDWESENAYPLQAFTAFYRYDRKRPRQITLVKGPAPQEEGGA
jgi:phage anti-repressor protein